jgi:hypothetical protein
LQGFRCELRDGLNLGGGDYFLFSRGDEEIVLVANDAGHAEVFIPDRATFPYYFYVYQGPEALLDPIRAALSTSGIACDLDDAASPAP